MKEGNNIFASLFLLAFLSIVSAIVLVCENSNHIVNSPPRTDPITSDADECKARVVPCDSFANYSCTPPGDCNQCNHYCIWDSGEKPYPPIGLWGTMTYKGYDCRNNYIECSFPTQYTGNGYSQGNYFRLGKYTIYVWFDDNNGNIWRGHTTTVVLDSNGMHPPQSINLQHYVYKYTEDDVSLKQFM